MLGTEAKKVAGESFDYQNLRSYSGVWSSINITLGNVYFLHVYFCISPAIKQKGLPAQEGLTDRENELIRYC